MTLDLTADGRRAAAEARPEGLFAHMIRLWIEHHRRLIELGLRLD